MSHIQTQPIEEQLKAFIQESLERPVPINVHDSLRDKGYIPSLQLIALVNFLESSFGVEVQPFDVTPDTFESISTIADYVRFLQERS